MTSPVKQPLLAALLVGGVLVGGSVLLSQNTPTIIPLTEPTKPDVTLGHDAVPLAVSGIVAASDRAVVAAKTSGVIAQYHVTEGSVVTPGMLLVSQALPAADAAYALAHAQGALTAAEQRAVVAAKTAAADTAALEAERAATIATIRASAGDARVREAATGLKTALSAQLLSTITAIDFIDDHRYLFDSTSLRLYDQAVSDLYGTIPNHFSTSLNTGTAINNHRDLYAAVENSSNTDPAALATLGELLVSEADLLTTVLTHAESDIFEDKTDTTTITYQSYRAARSIILASQTDTVTALSALNTAADAGQQDNTNQTAAVAVSGLDHALATAQVTYATDIAAAAALVSSASAAVAAAAASDGAVYAPFRGVVAEVFHKPGEYAAPGTPLLTLIGTGGRELTVHIPAQFTSAVMVGSTFTVRGKTAGLITRIAPVSNGKTATAIITLTEDTPWFVGTTLSGTLALTPSAPLYTVPRAYVHFDAAGSYLLASDGMKHPVTVVYDAVDTLLIITDETIADPLAPAVSGRLNQ